MELFDLYDDERKPLNKTIARGERCGVGENRVVVHICIFNKNNQMLIQQRQSFKKGWPNYWDITLGGCSISGETSKQSAHRELLEELGIDYDFANIRPHFTINFDNGFDDFYLLQKDIAVEDLKLQYEEVQAAKWATKQEIIDLIKSQQFIPYDCSFINTLFDLKNKRGLY